MKKSSIAAIIAGLIVLGFGIYWKLGGFNAIDLSIQDREDVKLLGLTYRGTPQDEGMVGTFQKIEKLLKDYPQTSLHTIYYTEPAGKLDTLDVFVGIEYSGLIAQKENLEVKRIPCFQVIVAEMQAHRLVMPSPETVKEQIGAFAKEKGLSLQGIYVDRILDKDRVEVIAPLGERKDVMGYLP